MDTYRLKEKLAILPPNAEADLRTAYGEQLELFTSFIKNNLHNEEITSDKLHSLLNPKQAELTYVRYDELCIRKIYELLRLTILNNDYALQWKYLPHEYFRKLTGAIILTLYISDKERLQHLDQFKDRTPINDVYKYFNTLIFETAPRPNTIPTTTPSKPAKPKRGWFKTALHFIDEALANMIVSATRTEDTKVIGSEAYINYHIRDLEFVSGTDYVYMFRGHKVVHMRGRTFTGICISDKYAIVDLLTMICILFRGESPLWGYWR